MTPHDDDRQHTRACGRCGGDSIYRSQAMVPGNPLAPRGSRNAESHPQPAWECVVCGYIEPHERRAPRSGARQSL